MCDEGTTSLDATKVPCPSGYVCDFGTTPDVSLFALSGKYQFLCPAGYACPSATGATQRLQKPCRPVSDPPCVSCCLPRSHVDAVHHLWVIISVFSTLWLQGYFCPTGTGSELLGIMASDSFVRGFSELRANPFRGEPVYVNKMLPGVRLPVNISDHDQYCYNVSCAHVASCG